MTTKPEPRVRASYSLIIGDATHANDAAIKGDSITELWDLRSMREHLAWVEGAVVDAARKDGRSWSEIGSALGMSKQAAQQKFGRPA